VSVKTVCVHKCAVPTLTCVGDRWQHVIDWCVRGIIIGVIPLHVKFTVTQVKTVSQLKSSELLVKFNPYFLWVGVAQEPASVAFSVLNLLIHFQGFSSFLVLVYYKLPLSAHGSPHYEYVSLWVVYGLLSMNSWIWSTVFHSRSVCCYFFIFISS
jgi:hypothetical protein